MSRITEVTAEAFEKLKLKTMILKQKIEGFTKIKEDAAEVHKCFFCAAFAFRLEEVQMMAVVCVTPLRQRAGENCSFAL